MTHASAAAGSAPALFIPLLEPAEAGKLIARTSTRVPDMAVPTMALTYRTCLEMGNDIGDIIERTGLIASLHWHGMTIPQLIEKGYEQAFPDKATQSPDRKYAFAMAALEEMDTRKFTRLEFENIISKVKASFAPRAALITQLIADGVITTDRSALIEVNKYSAMDDAHFVAQDAPITFESMDPTHGTLKKKGTRDIVDVMVDGKPVKCLRYNARGNGDCGLIALGLKRSDMQAAFERLTPFMHTGAGQDMIGFQISETKTRLDQNPTDHEEDSHIDIADAMTLGYALYGARVYVRNTQQNALIPHFDNETQDHMIGAENFAPDAPKIYLQLSPEHFDILVPEEDIKLRKHAAHVEFYSAFSILVSQAYAHKYGGTLNHTRLDENITHCALPLASDKLQFNMADLNRIVEAYDMPESLATIPGIVADILS